MIRKYNKKTRCAPLRIKLFWYLAVFFMFIILLLWVFQVALMDSFYRTITLRDMKKNALQITSVICNDGDVSSTAYRAAEASDACVSVYMIKDSSGKSISEAHLRSGCFIHNVISGETLNRIYNDTKEENGSLAREITFDDRGEDGAFLYSKIVEHGGTEYLILFNTEIIPVNAVSSTITVQLLLITVILIVGAGILAVVISRKITRPVSELSREANELAGGDYRVSFEAGEIEELNKLGEALGYAACELEKSDIMRRELIANITHDLRTPLTMISGYSEVMRDIPGEVTPENIQVIIDEAARLSALVNDVLEVFRTQNGAVKLNRTVFSITDTVKKEVKSYGELLSCKGYTVIYESDGAYAETEGDETKLMQAFCNLLNNAVNFTGEDKTVIVRQWVHDGVCRTEVTDSGSGIPKDELKNIWDRYYRARDRHNKGVPGSGLGLSIVKQIMLLHDASFGVDSTEGSGSTFWFEVPLADNR